jgi:hypothetical protein
MELEAEREETHMLYDENKLQCMRPVTIVGCSSVPPMSEFASWQSSKVGLAWKKMETGAKKNSISSERSEIHTCGPQR